MRARDRVFWGGVAALSTAVAGWAATPRHTAPAHSAARSAPAAAVGPVTGPLADYWVSVDTTSGFGAGMMAGGARPSMGSIMSMMAGRGGNSVAHGLTLQLGSTRTPSGAPAADHFVPAGLGVGASLPLVTPQPARERAESAEPGSPESYQRPKGRLLIYWGCGEHVGAGQPVVFDFSTIGTGAPLPDLAGSVRVESERPPAYGRAATYGHWPNEKRRVSVPTNGSLVGSHSVRGTYSPDIAFEVGPELDFMPPMGLQSGGASPGGGKRLTWSPSAQATGHHLMLIGASASEGGGRGGRGGRGGESLDMVFWSSSAVKPGLFGGGLADYLPPAEVRRLIAQRAVLPPETTQCVVPQEVAQAAPMGFVSGISYGPEQVFTDSPRPRSGPWNISWRTKVRVKSTGSLLLGMPGMGGDDEGGRPRRPGDRPQQPDQPTNPARELFKRFRPF